MFTKNLPGFIFKSMENKKCKSCKKTSLNKKEWLMIIIGIYILLSSVYGTISLYHKLFGN
jgi:hypothetical protein